AIRQAFFKRQHLVAVYFDLDKAYDTAWRSHILRTLHEWGFLESLPIFIRQFLSQRRFQVRIGTSLSSSRIQENGVPQGSVLSVTLRLIAIDGLVHCVGPLVTPALYVDDFCIWYSSYTV
ncbi:reverse transcriptase domain-containing protein, partial [Virgibacillus salexigens]|uniref:reverse transcriptase domain-containing protein n=1 Tax=Virgibacillus salexigens TaxID=61016 RepID=UPI00190DBE77